MAAHLPELDTWYQDKEGQIFKVIAVDEREQVAEIQFFDGSIEEIEFDTWAGMKAEVIDAPEDWSGPFDDLEEEDLDYASEIHSDHGGEWQKDIEDL
ncbi:MAG: hypothetical protein HY940_09125 [Gammaproteobacteria bacterium]|nr:hypothetical protein [Gammaproteobacteria bacterium]